MYKTSGAPGKWFRNLPDDGSWQVLVSQEPPLAGVSSVSLQDLAQDPMLRGDFIHVLEMNLTSRLISYRCAGDPRAAVLGICRAALGSAVRRCFGKLKGLQRQTAEVV